MLRLDKTSFVYLFSERRISLALSNHLRLSHVTSARVSWARSCSRFRNELEAIVVHFVRRGRVGSLSRVQFKMTLSHPAVRGYRVFREWIGCLRKNVDKLIIWASNRCWLFKWFYWLALGSFSEWPRGWRGWGLFSHNKRTNPIPTPDVPQKLLVLNLTAIWEPNWQKD